MADTSREERDRLQSHIQWLRGDHDRCNPWLANTIEALLDERDAARAMVAAASEIGAAIEKLALRDSFASCTCHTKTPDVQFHEANCRYVKLEYILGHAEAIRALATQDETDALDRLIAEAVKKEREANAQYLIDSIPTDAAPESIVAWVLRDRAAAIRSRGKAMSDVSPAVAFLHDEIIRLRAELERLREALAFYSCENNCLEYDCGRVTCGWTARVALKGETDD